MANVLRDALTTGLVEHVSTSYAVLALWLVGAWVVTARVIARRP